MYRVRQRKTPCIAHHPPSPLCRSSTVFAVFIVHLSTIFAFARSLASAHPTVSSLLEHGHITNLHHQSFLGCAQPDRSSFYEGLIRSVYLDSAIISARNQSLSRSSTSFVL